MAPKACPKGPQGCGEGRLAAYKIAAGMGRAKIVAEQSSLKPYWGKPVVRNFRGGEGNVGMVWRLFATQSERADTTEADRPKLGAPFLYSVAPI
jgi:hypothetical protein